MFTFNGRLIAKKTCKYLPYKSNEPDGMRNQLVQFLIFKASAKTRTSSIQYGYRKRGEFLLKHENLAETARMKRDETEEEGREEYVWKEVKRGRENKSRRPN